MTSGKKAKSILLKNNGLDRDMTDNYYFAEGYPFMGRELERLKAFLKDRGLDYDENITYTACIMDENTGEIAATGSMSGIILKCVAVSQNHHGQGLLNDLMSKLYETMYNKGSVHFIGFTKPENLGVFGHMGLYPIVSTDHIVYLENRKDEFKKYLDKLREKTGKEKCGSLKDDLLEQELIKCLDAGAPDRIAFPGYLIPPEQMPTYFIKDKEKSMEYRKELFLKVQEEIKKAIAL